MGRKLTDANRLSLRGPEVAAQWHPVKNGDLTPADVHYSSNKKVWWRCEVGQDHEWEATPSHRTSGKGCPFCAGKRVADSNRLSTNYPQLVPEWHPTRNGDLTPDDVTTGSNRKVWWACERGEDHEWEESPNARTSGKGCPFCAGKRVADSNRLSTNYPGLVPEWHSTRNGDLTPDKVTSGSQKKVWWLCENDNDHVWEAIIITRTRGGGCPYCAGKRPTDANRLSILFPDVANEWHPTKNGALTPHDVTYASNIKRWWACKRGDDHEWETAVCYRTIDRTGCPYCAGKRITDANRLFTQYPEVAEEWHPTKNGALTAGDVHYSSNKKVWWRCEIGEDHEWDDTPNHRTSGRGCPFCAGKRVADSNRLSTTHPELVPEWHPTRNGDLRPDHVTAGSNRKIWWLCGNGHEWDAVIASRASGGHGCPYCSGLHVSDANRLSIQFPGVANEWHPTENGDLTPHEVAAFTHRKVWWICEEGHEWEAAISSRTGLGTGCPYCAGLFVSDANRLSIRSPDVAKEWHPEKNGDLTPNDVSYASDKRAWWLCERGHTWDAVIGSRATGGHGCPYCRLTHRSRVEIHLGCELATFFGDIDPTRTHKISTPDGMSMNVDILIESQNLVIEYDGRYWHRGKLARDIEKTEMLQSAGWNVLRIREDPLELVQSSDLRCPPTYPDTMKDLVDRVLIHLGHEFGIEVPGSAEYLERKSLANRATADEIMGRELANQQRTASIQPDPELQLRLFQDW